MPKIHALTASVMANAALPCEYFSELMSQDFLAKVHVISIMNSEVLLVLNSLRTSGKLLTFFKSVSSSVQ